MYSDKMQKCTILHYHIYSAEILLHSEKGEDERGERREERERVREEKETEREGGEWTTVSRGEGDGEHE